MISTATAETDSSLKLRSDSEPAPSGDFPHSVNWGNPRVAAILDAAAQCFSQRGFTATTLADIGKELGLRKSIVHYYFTSKATLVQEVQSFAYGRYLAVLRTALLGERSEGGPESGTMLSLSGPDGADTLRGGLKLLWNRLQGERSIRGLNLELWSEGRRNLELSERAQTLEAEAHKLIKDHVLSTSDVNEAKAEDLATLTLAVLDGLTVREEREGNGQRSSRAFAAFVDLMAQR
jgi:AcrR family transcriptional regulator